MKIIKIILFYKKWTVIRVSLWLDKKERCYKKLKVAATYVPTDVACSIIGDGRLDFQVRNGAGYDPPSSPTTKRSKSTAVRLLLFALESLSKINIVKSLGNVDYNFAYSLLSLHLIR